MNCHFVDYYNIIAIVSLNWNKRKLTRLVFKYIIDLIEKLFAFKIPNNLSLRAFIIFFFFFLL